MHVSALYRADFGPILLLQHFAKYLSKKDQCALVSRYTAATGYDICAITR
jgi:hypothetical protein